MPAPNNNNKRRDNTPRILKDYQIRVPEVRLLDEEKLNLGVMKTPQALQLAQSKGLNLILINAVSTPPIAQIYDYGKYKYDLSKQEKKTREIKRNEQETKEVQLSAVIDIGDFNTRAKQARKFLEDGDKVKVRIMMKGRQNLYPERSIQVMKDFAENLKDVGEVTQPPKKDAVAAKVILMMIEPIKK
ncbi:MAG: translation initiation factor IF-3 [Christensenellaceae bacterium]|nr:translation initiation factor IF-3 [Christensenellaceae bacterium]